MNYADIEKLARALPETVTGTSYGTPALKVGKKLLVRLTEDGETIVLCAVLPDERALLIEMAPDVFHVTDHYAGYPAVLVRLHAADAGHMASLLRQSWARLASKKARARDPG
jgi:hypothetical protein